MELVGLLGIEDKLPNEISGGMRKRAGLARAVVLDPEIVLFDEPDRPRPGPHGLPQPADRRPQRTDRRHFPDRHPRHQHRAHRARQHRAALPPAPRDVRPARAAAELRGAGRAPVPQRATGRSDRHVGGEGRPRARRRGRPGAAPAATDPAAARPCPTASRVAASVRRGSGAASTASPRRPGRSSPATPAWPREPDDSMATSTPSRVLAPIGVAGNLFAFALDVGRGLFRRPFQMLHSTGTCTDSVIGTGAVSARWNPPRCSPGILDASPTAATSSEGFSTDVRDAPGGVAGRATGAAASAEAASVVAGTGGATAPCSSRSPASVGLLASRRERGREICSSLIGSPGSR